MSTYYFNHKEFKLMSTQIFDPTHEVLNRNNTDFTSNTHSTVGVIIGIPVALLIPFLVIFIYLTHKGETNPNLKNKVRVILYFLAQYLLLPFLLIFLLVNCIVMFVSYFFLKKLLFFSVEKFLKDAFACKKKSTDKVKIVRKPSDEESKKAIDQTGADQDRVNRYKIANDDSNGSQGNVQDNLNLNRKGLFDSTVNRPNTSTVLTKTANKSKIFNFLANALINEDGTPGYVNLIRSIKNEAKVKMENRNKVQGAVIIRNNL